MDQRWQECQRYLKVKGFAGPDDLAEALRELLGVGTWMCWTLWRGGCSSCQAKALGRLVRFLTWELGIEKQCEGAWESKVLAVQIVQVP